MENEKIYQWWSRLIKEAAIKQCTPEYLAWEEKKKIYDSFIRTLKTINKLSAKDDAILLAIKNAETYRKALGN